MAVKRVFVSLVLLCLCAVLVTEFIQVAHQSVPNELLSKVLLCSTVNKALTANFFAVEICILTQNFVYKQHNNESLVTVRCIRCLFSAGFLPAFNIIRRRATVRPVAWPILLLMAVGDIHLSPGPALRCNGQPDIRSCLHRVLPAMTASGGHCLLYVISMSVSTFLHINLPPSSIANVTRDELLYHPGKYQPFLNVFA